MSLGLSYDDSNIFAKIIRGEMPAHKVFEDDVAIAFLDIFPQSEGHTLVIPTSGGATNLLDVDRETLSALIARVQRVAKGVVAALSPDGVRIVQYNGAPAGQTVFHLHFHIIPIFENRTIAGHGVNRADMAALAALATKISANI